MDEQVIDDLYQRAVSQGYKKSKQEFVTLLHSDDEVFKDMYSYVKSKGYQKSTDDFSALIGKKKGGTVSGLAGGVSAQPTSSPKFLEEQLAKVTPQLIGQEEESVVPQMNYQFGPMGFKFEESGATGDWMTVTAPNGKKTEISLDPFTSSKEASESKALQKFLRENAVSIPNLSTLEREYSSANKKFTTQKEVDDSVLKMNQEQNAYRVKSQELLKRMNDSEAERKEIEATPQTLRSTPEFQTRVNNYRTNAAKIQEDINSMAKTEAEIRNKSQELNAAVGKYSAMKAEQGTWWGAIWNKVLSGASQISSAAANNMVDLLVETMPKGMMMGKEEYRSAVIEKAKARGIKPPPTQLGLLKGEEEYNKWYNSLSEDVRDDIDNEIEDEAKKEVKYGKKDELTGQRKDGMLDAIRMGNRTVMGDPNTTPEWEQLKSKGFWGGAVLGLAQSVPAMIGGSGPAGWAQRTAQMYAQISDNVNEEMSKNPAFDNVSESEKLLVSAPIAIASGVLEAYGFRNVIANKGLLNGVVLKALGKAGATTTAKSFGELVKNEVKNGIARGALTVVGGALAEGETGAAQEFAEAGIKDIYNLIKNKKDENGDYMKMFNTPNSIGEYVKNIAISGAQEAVGGAIMGSIPGIAAAYRKQGFLGMSDEQFHIFEMAANDTRIEKAFIAGLKNNVNTGEMTMEQAKETLNDYRNAVGLFNSLPDNLDTEGKKKAMNLLKEKRGLETQIDGKDEALTQPQRDRIKAINEELTKISQESITKRQAKATELNEAIAGLKDDENVTVTVKTLDEVPEEFRDRAVKKEGMQVEMREKVLGLPIGKKTSTVINDGYTYTLTGKEIKDYAIQKQSTDEGLLRSQGPELELPKVGEGNQEPQIIAQGTQVQTQGGPQEVVSSKTRINVAPFFNTQVGSVEEAAALREAPAYKQYLNSLNEIAKKLNVPAKVVEFIGGYKNDAGEDIVEISNLVELDNATMEQTEEFAALAAALAPEVQEASIAARYVEQGDKTHNANEYVVKVDDVNKAIKALKDAGITDFSINEETGEVGFIDVFDFTDAELQTKIGRFTRLLEENNTNYEQSDFKPVESRRIGQAERRKILGRVKEKGTQLGQGGQNLLQTLEQAVQRDSEYQGIKPERYYGPRAGNRLFNEPLKAVAEIADRYFQRVFGTQRPKFEGTEELDVEKSKRIADAFAAMKNDPNNPKVKEAYEALAKETLDQYQAFLDAGYRVEINNKEPYNNSQEMIDDLRENKRIKIFSTESGFGENPITEQQRQENPLLRDSGFKDANGQPMLVNDVFRAIHDFFGHAELGNSFGPKGEENAWQIHARMFSPLARAAMTTETRGQNSYVNFSGENQKVEEIREQARKLREEGKEEEAKELVRKIYNEMAFAEQKVGLLPEEFYQIEEDIMTADTKDATTLEKVYDFLDKLDEDLTKFGKETAGINIALPVMKAIIKTVKALVATGITLQEAIKRAAAENKVSEQDVLDTISILSEQRMQEGKPQGVTEMELPGYNRMMNELEGVIEKSRERGVEEDKVMQNAIDYLQGSKVYEDASDTQREQMIRDVRKMFGKREKAAPKPEKLFGEAKDVKQITMSEYDLLKKQLADTARGAKNAKVLWLKTSSALTKYLKQMREGGYVSAKQVATILRKFGSVNMFDENSIGRFVDYMAKVFKNANYAEQIEQVMAKLKVAKRNAQTKVGVSQSLTPLLTRLFSINPTLIPDSVFNEYVDVVNMMGERKAVLQLEESGKLLDKVEGILSAVEEEVSLSEELAERFDAYEDKVLDDEGKLDFAATVKKMLDSEVITPEEAELMKKYKKNIVPPIERKKKTEAELEEEKKVLVETVKDSEVDSDGLPMKDERNKARELAKLLKTDAVSKLTNEQLKNLIRTIDNINNGFLTNHAEMMVETLNSLNKDEVLDKALLRAKPLKASEMYARLKSLLTGKDKISELIRRNPLYYIDQLFGDYNTKDIYDAIFEKSAEAQSMFKRSVTELNNKLDAAEEGVAKSFKFNGNKITMSKFKMMTFLVQLEYESNPDNNKVNPAAKYLEKTIDHIKNGKSRFGEADANMLQEILDQYGKVVGKDDKGKDIIEIDNSKLYDSFNEAEKKAIKTVQDINEGLRDKALYTAAVIRGDKIHPLNNYIHLNVLHEYKADEALSGASFVESYNNSLRPSTKAKSLIERTGKVSPLNFDVFASASRGAKFVLMDYYLTEPIRTARKTINNTSKLLKERKAPKQQVDILNAIDRAYEEAVENLLTDNFTSSSFGDKVAEFMSKQGYRAVLASLPRFAAEFSSNVAFAMIAAPQDFTAGIGYRNIVKSAGAATIMNNLASKLTNRIFPHDTLSGRLIDTNILNQASGVKGSRAKGDVANKINQAYNITLKKYKNSVELVADTLISTPDKLVMRPMWFGAFANEFKRLTGKEVDFEKIEANDEKYMAENKEALDKARDVADQKAVLTGASDNAFMGVLKGKSKENQTMFLKAFNTFNNFMTNFLIYEYVTARTGIMAAMGNGSISKRQGWALMGAVTARMTLYTLMSTMLTNAMIGLFVPDEDDDDDKTLLQKLGQALASSFSSMIFTRDFGNATKSIVNQGIEYANAKYLDFLRNGKYDPYKDAIQYTILPPEKKVSKTAFQDMMMNMMGPFGPAMKTTEFAIRKATEEPKKEAAAAGRVEQEKQVRLPLEILGNLGMVPLYKDMRRIVNAEIYKDLDKADRNSDTPMMKESDMKRYYPDLWNQIYGPGSADYDKKKLKREMQKAKRELERKMKDEMYNYVPKKKEEKKEFGKGGFGESKFGETKKKKSTFGSSKFGSK